MVRKIANNFREAFIQFSNLNGCAGTCDEDPCKDYNALAQKKYTPAGFLGFGAEKGELTKSNILDGLSGVVCNNVSKDTKFKFLCFSEFGRPDLSVAEYAEMEKVAGDVFWDEMVREMSF